ncbi:MAG TPA: Gfo/Idh/MocA family oxidoreductase, partial [Thermoleophilaceae bacterium]|nr:Gfo/Idh/MocA family oxidoreductase [Thermoleophilaceae bacterium]
VGVQDPSPESLAKAAEGVATYAELGQMLDATRPDVLLVCPVISAHVSAAEAGLAAGCHVLVEKPLAVSTADGARLVEQAEAKHLRLGVVQNWRTKSVGQALHQAIRDGAIGEVSHVFFRYLRDRELPHLPDYLFEEEDPILYAMSIHHFDLFRYALGQDFVSVQGHATTPSWSRYKHASVLQLWMEMERGAVVGYTATFSSRNAHFPLESLQIEGEKGTLHNESQYSEPPLLLSRRGDDEPLDLTAQVTARDQQSQYELGDLAILQNFRDSVVNGAPLVADARDNLGTLAAIDAARDCLRSGEAVAVARPDAILERS